MARGPVGDGELVGPHGQTAPPLETVDASLDRVAPLVRLRAEGERATIRTASPQPVADPVGGPGDDSADSASAEAASHRAG
nr:hypothetical protein [Streptomyces termitum]